MKSLKTLAGVGARDIFAFLSSIVLNPFIAKFFFSHWCFHYFGHKGLIFYGSVFKPFGKRHAYYIRKMYKRAISRPFSTLIFKPLYCKILLLELVFSLINDRQKSTLFINFCVKIMSGASVAVGHPLQVLCFLYFGEPFLARWTFGHFSFFFIFFHVFARMASLSKFGFSPWKKNHSQKPS